jgi:hypothetical protein
MFERYSENSRRAIYFARTEALARVSAAIGTKDLLLGLTHELYEEGCPFAELHTRRDELRALMNVPPIEKMPEAKDIPLDREAKIALAYAAQEANRGRKFSVMPYDLLCGIVLGGDSTAIALSEHGWDIETIRAKSIESRRLFPPKRPSLRRILKRYRWPIIKVVIPFALLAALIEYLRWQQR